MREVYHTGEAGALGPASAKVLCMSARDLCRGAVIELELDPALIPQKGDPIVDAWIRGAYQCDWRLRLSPCKGGVRFLRLAHAHKIHATPASLAGSLEDLAQTSAGVASGYPPDCATRVYWEDRAAFWRLAARAVCKDPRILRMWGLS